MIVYTIIAKETGDSLNFLLYLILTASSVLSVGDSDGWVKIEKPYQSAAFDHAGDEDNPDLWVVFSKQFGAEHFTVRFPEDPQYNYPSLGEMAAKAFKDGESYQLTVLSSSLEALDQRAKGLAAQPGVLWIESTQSSSCVRDILYQTEGKWVREHLLLTPHHLYIFQTTSPNFQSEGHQYFIQSLEFSSS